MKPTETVGTTEKESIRRSIHDMFLSVLDNMIANNDIAKLRPGEKADFLMKLAAYIIPKPGDDKEEDANKSKRDINAILADLNLSQGSQKGSDKTLKKEYQS